MRSSVSDIGNNDQGLPRVEKFAPAGLFETTLITLCQILGTTMVAFAGVVCWSAMS